MNLPKVALRKDPQILAALVAAKKLLSLDPFGPIAWVCEAVDVTESPVALEITDAISDALRPFALFPSWMKNKGYQGDKQALRHQWVDSMILDQIRLPTVKLRRRPEIKAILLAAKTCLAQRIGDRGQIYLCHAVSKAAFDLGLFSFFKEVQAAILAPLGGEENTAYEFFRQQHEGLSNDQCQALRHRWLDQMIEEQE